MPVDLSTPLAWKTATGDAATMLDELQPNILKAHARDGLSVLFLHFGDTGEAKRFLASLVPLMKSAKTHLTEVERFKQTGATGTPYVDVGSPRTVTRACMSATPRPTARSARPCPRRRPGRS